MKRVKYLACVCASVLMCAIGIYMIVFALNTDAIAMDRNSMALFTMLTCITIMGGCVFAVLSEDYKK